MKRLYVTVIILLFTLFALAQKEGNIWYFGYNAGIDFNSGAPVSISGSAMYTEEGCSSICDTSGNLLFYTDGSNVWDASHNPMPNGTGLSGNTTSSQSALIIKQPGTQHTYYIFSLFTDYCYSIVDMSLHGGLGDVTSAKNVMIYTGINTEKQCATHHSNGTDVWIAMHAVDKFYSYLLTSSGLTTTPVISTEGVIDTFLFGIMRFSPSGDKLAMGIYSLPDTLNVSLMDFDKSTGVFSNSLNFANGGSQCYGVEFSPNGSKLYATLYPGNFILQYDLNAGSPSAILASKINVGYTGAIYNPTGMQLAPDGKIYIALPNAPFISSVDNPDSSGAACNFTSNSVPLISGLCQLSFPQIISDYLNPPVGIENVMNDAAITIYPNPSENYLYIQQSYLTEHETISITDLMGRKFLEMQVTSALQKIDISNLSAAVYLVRISHGKKHAFCKLIKK